MSYGNFDSKLQSYLENNVKFYKEQILYYQDLLKNAVNKQNRNFETNFEDSEFVSNEQQNLLNKLKKYTLKEANSRKDDESSFLKFNESKISAAKKAKSSTTNLDSKFESKFLESDMQRMRNNQLKARNKLNPDVINIENIRDMENKLILSGMTPEKARIKTQKELYPASLSQQKNRSHELLKLRDSDSDSDLSDASDGDDDNDNKSFKDKCNELFEESEFDKVFSDIQEGNEIDPDDILEETNIAYFED